MTLGSAATGSAGVLAAAAFVGCAVRNVPDAGTGARARRRQVTVGGKRVKTVDMHAHCAFPELAEMVGAGLMSEFGVSMADRLADMDAQGIDVAALSVNAFWYHADRDVSEALIKTQNEKLAELCAAQPDRFVAFATIALQHPDLAVEQIEYGVRKLGLRGVSIATNCEGADLAEPQFHPVWAKVEELGCPLFMHPLGGTPELRDRLKGNGGLNNVIGQPLDTTIALSKLIMEGTLDRFPALKICTCHGGSYLPFYPPRLDAVLTTFPERQKIKLRKLPSEYLKDMYHDSIVFTPQALAYLVSVVGPGHVYLGTDYPFTWATDAVDLVLKTESLSDDDKRAILGETAAALLGIED